VRRHAVTTSFEGIQTSDPVHVTPQRGWRPNITPEFRVTAFAFFVEQVVELSTWVATILYCFSRNGAKTAGLFMSAMLVTAAAVAPMQARLLERFRPFRAACVQFGSLAAVSAATSASVALRAPGLVTWICLGLLVCCVTTAPSTLFGLIPSTARGAESLAEQNALMGWAESAAMVVGPVAAGLVLSRVEVRVGVGIITGGATALLFLATIGLLRHARSERSQDVVAADLARDQHAGPNGRRPIRLPATPSSYSERELLALPAIRTLVVVAVGAYLSIGALDVLFVPVSQAAGINESRAGFLVASYGVGSLLAFSVTRRVVSRRRLVFPLVAFGLLGSVAISGLALAGDRVVLVVILVGLSGACRAVFVAVSRVLSQRNAPTGSLLRVSALFQVVMNLAFAIGVLVPWLAGSTQRACIATGLILPLSLLVVAVGLRKVDDTATVPVTEIALLREVAILRSLQHESVESLARVGYPQTFRDEAIFEQGDLGFEMFVVVDGSVEVRQGSQVVRNLGRGDIFGEIALLRSQPRSASVFALGQARVFVLPGEDFLAFVGRHDAVASAVENLISHRR
jgi:Cyclic nucleotide-binding domain/Major Facilitator Superfamily